MYEVELKVRADHDRVRAALEQADAERLSRVRQVDTYYDAPHRDFAETDEAFRIRRETVLDAAETGETSNKGDGEGPTQTTKVTYKGPLVDAESKTREEHETVVLDGDAMAGILDGIGFEPAATVEKERTFYRVDDYTVTLDHVVGLGAFCEIEAEADEAHIEQVRDGAIEVLDRLDLDADDQIRTSYLGLLLAAQSAEDN